MPALTRFGVRLRASRLQRLAGRVERARVSRELRRLSELDRLEPTTTSLPGCRLRLVDGPAFVSQWRAIFMEGHYAFMPDDPRPRILDCGANIGLASLYWARTITGASITAFEPDPVLATLLRENLEGCHAPNVEVVEAAVWHTNGEAAFETGSPDAGRLRPGGHGTKVRTVRLRDYLTEPVSLLKLDIEGAEVEVLRDCAGHLGEVAHVFVEFHSYEGQRQHLAELLSILEGGGFRIQLGSEFASPQPFLERRSHLGMDLQANVYAYRT